MSEHRPPTNDGAQPRAQADQPPTHPATPIDIAVDVGRNNDATVMGASIRQVTGDATLNAPNREQYTITTGGDYAEGTS